MSEPAFTPIARRSLAGEVFSALCAQILHGGFEPGRALPPERELCEQLGVRRGALREGIKRLEQAGLLTVRHGGGTFVRDYRRSAGLDMLPALLIRPDGGFAPEVVRSVMEMRSALAPEIARQAARRRNDAQLGRMSAVLDALIESLDRTASSTTAERSGAQRKSLALGAAFWDELVEASANIAYRLSYNSLLKTADLGGSDLDGLMLVELQPPTSHAALLEAVRSRDTERAVQLAFEITERGRHGVEAALPPRETES